MRRSPSERSERRGLDRLEALVGDLGWIFRDVPLPDYGVDAQIEVVDDNQYVTGRLIGVQVKSGSSYFRERLGNEGWLFRDSENHLGYWLGYSLPVIVVLVDPSGNAFWQHVSVESVKETKQGFSMVIPERQQFTRSCARVLLDIAGTSQGVLDRIAANYVLLPPDGVRPLRRAESTDRLATARLADRLATGRAQPGLTVDSLLAAKPAWLSDSAAAQDLWMAVGGYSIEHELMGAGLRAFNEAACSEGHRKARAHALAGWAALLHERSAAAPHLQAALADGERLLAAAGLAVLDAPEDDARAFATPRAVLDASDEELDREPTVLNLLAELSLRRKDINEAIRLRERALRMARRDAEGGTGIRLELAKNLARRAHDHTSAGSQDLRSALSHAEQALEERRRWEGPSGTALAVVLDILIAMGDLREAAKRALSASLGGLAGPLEATDERILYRGGFASFASGREDLLETFLSSMSDECHRSELVALREEGRGAGRDQCVVLFSEALSTSTDDALTARCGSRLARYGVWASELDDLLKRSTIDLDTHTCLTAVFRAYTNAEDGIAHLRHMARTSVLAEHELVDLIERTHGFVAAASECRRLLRHRRANPSLALLLLSLLQRAGQEEEATRVGKEVLADADQPVSTRLDVCKWLVATAVSLENLEEAAHLARAGLQLSVDAELSWALIFTLRNAGRLADARAELDRYRPPPVRPAEVQIWLLLHLGVPLSGSDAEIMVDIARRRPEGQLRSAIAGILKREVLSNPSGVEYRRQLYEAAQEVVEDIELGPGRGIQILEDDELQRVLEARQPDPAVYERLVADLRAGRASHIDVAEFADRPYGSTLLHQPAGLTYAADLSPQLRQVGETAAAGALKAGACLVDLSALYSLSVLGEELALQLLSQVPLAVVAPSILEDCGRTRDDIRSFASATELAFIGVDGKVHRQKLKPRDRAQVLARSEAIERLASHLLPLPGSPWAGPVDQSIDLARRFDLSVWCDDSSLRQRMRQAALKSFSILDLASVVNSQGLGEGVAQTFERLAGSNVVDLPLDASHLVQLASAQAWVWGAAHVALSRAEWWTFAGDSWREQLLIVARSACKHSVDALVYIARAALTGALQAVNPGLRTQRFQEVQLVALISCVLEEMSTTRDLLLRIEEPAPPGLAPSWSHLRSALLKELQDLTGARAEELTETAFPASWLMA